jgi:bacillithiol biosynthesis cysteine-adding enzyme BshC
LNEILTAGCHPIDLPGPSRLFQDYCSGNGTSQNFYAPGSIDLGWAAQLPRPAHWQDLIRLVAEQNPSPAAAPAIEALGQGAGTVLTGQQVTLFGGPLFTPFKAATALARAREATAAGHAHVAIFWLATEDHDFAEINNVTFPARRELRRLEYASTPSIASPVGGVIFDESITPLVEQAGELLGFSEALDALAAAYQPGCTFAEAFRDFYAQVFAAQGLLIIDAGGRAFHRLGASVLRAALERADELHAALLDRNRELEAAGYHAQVAVGPQSSLLFLIDEKSGERVALKRTAPSVQEPNGLWTAGVLTFSTADLLGILDAAPECISPSALLRPVFQDFLFSTSLIVGGPAEVAYFAQSSVLYERILGRVTPAEPRFSATLVEPGIDELLHRHGLTLEEIIVPGQSAASLAQLLATRSMPIEGQRKLMAASENLEAELTPLVDWMRSCDEELGRSAATAASKMRYQMNRLQRLAANFQLQREASLGRNAETITQALYPRGALQERTHGAAYYFARHGFELAEKLTAQAAKFPRRHTAVWL